MKESKFIQLPNVIPFLKNPNKCKSSIVTVRSGWELKFIMKYLDVNQNILEWTSEDTIVKYLSPIDGKYHRYFIDFAYKARTKSGEIKEFWIEIKPYSQSVKPKEPKRKTIGYLNEVKTYLVNSAKWETTKQLVEDYNKKGRDITFCIITEKDCPWFV